jgi:hypothetical protein
MNGLVVSVLLILSGMLLSPSTRAEVGVSVNISLPPPIVVTSSPTVIIIPETYVYVVPDVDADIYFYNGWWWRLWDGRWYRSRNFNSDWSYRKRVPSFYEDVPTTWRNDYRDRRWAGHQWNYQRIPQRQLQQNWRNWKRNNHWEKKQNWDVPGLKSRTRQEQRPRTDQHDTHVVQPVRVDVKQQQPRPHPQAVQSQHPPQTGKPPVRVDVKQQQTGPHPQAVQPQHSQPTPQTGKPPVRVDVKQQQTGPHPQAVQPRQIPPSQQIPHPSKPQPGKHEQGDEKKQERK